MEPPGSLKSRMPSSPPGAQHAMELAQSGFVIGEIAEAEGGGDEVEAAVRQRKMEGVGFDDGGIVVAKLFRGAREHGVGKIGGEDGLRVLRAMAQQGQGHVSRAAANVEDGGLGLREDCAKAARGATPPEAVDVAGEDVVQQVVARGDAVEHFPHGGGGALLVGGSGGLRSGGAHRRGLAQEGSRAAVISASVTSSTTMA